MLENSQKFLKLAIIGAPNVGKSLLTNQLVKANVAAVSKRIDTTRKNMTAVFTKSNYQFAVVDSPGLVGIKHANTYNEGKNSTLLTDPEKAMKQSEHVLVVHDATLPGDYIHHRAMFLLHKYSHLPSTLVINKVDLIEDRTYLLPLVKILAENQVGGNEIVTKRVSFGKLGKVNEKRIDKGERDDIPLYDKNNFSLKGKDENWKILYDKVMAKPYDKCSWSETKKLFLDIRGWPNFDSVFFVSSLTGEGIDALRIHLIDQTTKRKWLYDKNTITTKNPKEICLDMIRAECLNYLPSEVGYGLEFKIMDWSHNDDQLDIIIDIIALKKRWAKLLFNSTPPKLRLIEQSVNYSLQNLLNEKLYVKLLAKYKGKTVSEGDYETI
ncbi:GTPase Era, mitochondrial [Strongyloides ratti]|uniref:GTPase Era, mitochondrial n=1 Tax=Strongyloides ratti TaxID=34506 RepID=A0A090L0G9_STRRB|nr:GTPase Era, mitochondrial [Strongyloides ratti]CEF63245.1 GTPase Era, mitochondrial [Strongyloides ratti]